MFINDLDFGDGFVYFIDTSYLRDVNEALEEHVEAQPRGRLFSFNEKSNVLKMLQDNLYFPNGIQIMPDRNSLLINENTMARIIRYYLHGEKQGMSEVFTDLPGFGDTIRMTELQTLLVPFGIARYSYFHSMLDLLGKIPFVRNLILNVKTGFIIYNLIRFLTNCIF
jgi:hypothetical protein